MQTEILSVSLLTEYVRSQIDADPTLRSVAVRGEISNYKLYPSGHHYFTLKDENASLKCVMFRANAVKLKFRPENGMKVIALGRVSVYPRDGVYQLYCTTISLDGIGDLHTAFEQLKQRLSVQGLFAQEHKKPLPVYPKTIGIITSSAGAAIHDMLRILRKRYPLVKVLLLPVRVQGEEAPGEIAAAIRYANRFHLADLLIVGRGGGSIEDLWAFNDERVAHAIFGSQIPVISAVGHEPDVTISDFVADVRASTPSNAAEIAVPDHEALRQLLDSFEAAMHLALSRQLKSARNHLDLLSQRSCLQTPAAYIQQKQRELDTLSQRMDAAQQHYLYAKKQGFMTLTAKIDAMSPLKVLSRGYAMVQKKNEEVMRSVRQTEAGECLKITLSDGWLQANVTQLKENTHGTDTPEF